MKKKLTPEDLEEKNKQVPEARGNIVTIVISHLVISIVITIALSKFAFPWMHFLLFTIFFMLTGHLIGIVTARVLFGKQIIEKITRYRLLPCFFGNRRNPVVLFVSILILLHFLLKIETSYLPYVWFYTLLFSTIGLPIIIPVDYFMETVNLGITIILSFIITYIVTSYNISKDKGLYDKGI